MSESDQRRKIDELRAEARRLELELAEAEPAAWRPPAYYFTYHVVAGAFLGLFAGMTSLLANVVGANLVAPPEPLPRDALNIVRVYLTFPLGEAALSIDHGVALAIGCCLYLITGAALGIPFHLVLSKWFGASATSTRLIVAGAMGVAVWLINYYGILSWLQPLLFDGRWIVDLIPWWVAAGTHVVFGLTMALTYPLGAFVPQAHGSRLVQT